MLKEILTPTGSALPLIALVLFVGIALLVILYIVTDRRRGHRSRMEAMPLDDETLPPTDSPKKQP
ncbi:MAG TPA: hypothetical protein VHX44_17040 [Planctomycetota bacterium]|nr:hypothetical protein [Planctomycetota bacterium]